MNPIDFICVLIIAIVPVAVPSYFFYKAGELNAQSLERIRSLGNTEDK